MTDSRNKKTMPIRIAVVLILLIALAGSLVVYMQHDQKVKLIAANEQFRIEQEQQVMSVFNRIEANLAKIREKESMIQQNFLVAENNSELGPEDGIQQEIEFIEYLMDENNKLIASLSQQVADKDSRIKKYEGAVKELNSRITKYQADMAILLTEKEGLQNDLNVTTAAKNRLAARVDTLGNEIVYISNQLENQKQVVIQKENDLNTAYYAVGQYKDLRDKNIIQKEGGFMGINRVTTLKGNPNEEVFHEIDIREITQIPVSARRWEIVTDQDPSSYELEIVEDQLASIKITDPQKFWKKTKYLVVVIRDKESDDLASSR